jgi:putative restriction endonuclease
MDKYFPQLAGVASTSNPTVSCNLNAALFVGSQQVSLVTTRYQYQTRAGTRSPERRITGQLGPLLGVASADDILIIERSLSDEFFYRLILHKVGTLEYSSYSPLIGDRRCGSVDPADAPVPEVDIINAEQIQSARELQPFRLFDNAAALHETRVSRIARSQAFKKILLPLYDRRCAVCGLAHAGPDNLTETEGAHIVPRRLKGADDSRNGLALCRSHHWAFDRGLFGVDSHRKILVRPSTLAEPRNHHLVPFHGQNIRSPSSAVMKPSSEALEWHLENVVRP